MSHLIIKRAKNGKGQVRWNTRDTVKNIEEVLNYYNAPSAKFTQTNIFYQINPTKYHHTKVSKKMVLNTVVIPLDIDGMDMEHFDDLETELLDFFDKLRIKSYVTINSGNGLHALINIGLQKADWLEKNKFAIKDIIYTPVESIASQYGGKMDTSVLEGSRILRVPFTVNEKDGKEPKQCYIATNNWVQDEPNTRIVEIIEKEQSTKTLDKHNVSMQEIIDAFSEIGGKWRQSSPSYAYLEHPLRGSQKVLTLYSNAKHFYSFSDKDTEMPFSSLTDVWNMFGTGKPDPFKQFSPKNIAIDVAKKFKFDFRYVNVQLAQPQIIMARHTPHGSDVEIVSRARFKTKLARAGAVSYMQSIGVNSDLDAMFDDLLSALPSNKLHAQPIDTDREAMQYRITSLLHAKFDAPDELSKNRKVSLYSTIMNKDEATLLDLGIKIREDTICIPYYALQKIIDTKTLEGVARSTREFSQVLEWVGNKVSEYGMMCAVKGNSLHVMRNEN